MELNNKPLDFLSQHLNTVVHTHLGGAYISIAVRKMPTAASKNP